jgi:hypothetical protein
VLIRMAELRESELLHKKLGTTITIHALYPKQRATLPKVRVFLEFLEQCMRKGRSRAQVAALALQSAEGARRALPPYRKHANHLP